MRQGLFLTGFFARKRLLSPTALLLTLLAALLLLAGFLSTTMNIQRTARLYGELSGGAAVVLPVQAVEKGSVHGQVWEATSFAYLHSYPIIGGALLPFRNAALWLFVMLPFVGLLLSACEVSGELQSGVAQTLYGAPVPRSMLAVARILGDSVAVTVMIAVGVLAALAVGSLVVGYEIPAVHIERSAVFILILGFYTSVFVQAGNLVSALSRQSSRSLWVCVMVGLGLMGAYLAGDNLMNASRDPSVSIPLPRGPANYQLSGVEARVIDSKTDEELDAMIVPELADYLSRVSAHAAEVHRELRADYHRERWYGLISPIHAIWEVAQQLLQDRHNASTEIFAPLAAMDPPPSIRRSLAEAWPELAGMVFVWLALFAINVRVLSRLEV